MFSKFRDRRRDRRYRVQWEARLEVRFAGTSGEMAVAIADISRAGALVQSPRMDLEGRHLTVTRPLPRIALIMDTPQGQLTAEAEIRWYRWSVTGGHFEIGVGFTHLSAENQHRMDRLMIWLKQSGAPAV
jgi:hypothetical protein